MTCASLPQSEIFIQRCNIQTNSDSIVVFDNDEYTVVHSILKNLESYAPNVAESIMTQITSLEQIATALSHYPSLRSSTVLAGEKRSEKTLIENLCNHTPDTRLLALPTKVVIGKSFLIAKFQTFSAMTKIAMNAYFEESDIQELRRITLRVMFALMAEDVYTMLLDNAEMTEDIRKELAEALTDLWEHWFDGRSSLFAGVLHKVWNTRYKVAPNFGTMLGISELFLFSMELDDSWEKFMLAKLSDAETVQVLEEFLFGISYEQITLLRHVLKERKISALSREEAAELAGITQPFPTNDPRVFYSSFVERKNNAEARRRMQIEGPKRTLEELYIQFIFEQYHTS